MTNGQYIDVAIEIPKNAKYPYHAIVVKNYEISKKKIEIVKGLRRNKEK